MSSHLYGEIYVLPLGQTRKHHRMCTSKDSRSLPACTTRDTESKLRSSDPTTPLHSSLGRYTRTTPSTASREDNPAHWQNWVEMDIQMMIYNISVVMHGSILTRADSWNRAIKHQFTMPHHDQLTITHQCYHGLRPPSRRQKSISICLWRYRILSTIKEGAPTQVWH